MPTPTYPVRTARLDLRPYTDADLDFVLACRSDPAQTRYVPFDVVGGEEEAQAVLVQKIYRSAAREPGEPIQLVAELRATNEPVGEATLVWASEVHQGGEVGYLVLPGHQGRGYATEMAAAMLRLAFQEFGWHRVTARLDARNDASVAVCERLGMRREAHLLQNEWVKDEWTDELDYAMLAAEWPASKAAGLSRWVP